MDATGQRRVASLANNNFRLHYRSGKTNVDADALSRIPWNNEIPCSTWEQPVIKAVVDIGSCGDKCSLEPLLIENVDEENVTSIISKQLTVNSAPKLTPDNWRREPQQDPEIGPVIDLISQKTYLQYNTKETDPSGLRFLLKYRKDLWLHRGLLYRKVKLKIHEEMVVLFDFLNPSENK